MSAVVTHPTGGQSLSDAVDWVRALLLGSASTTVAILAVAAIGLLMFNGHVPTRRGVRVVIGCFILFSASVIANGILMGFNLSSTGAATSPSPEPNYQPTDPQTHDPYAGAAVPNRGDRDFFGKGN